MRNASSPSGFAKLRNQYLGPHFLLFRLFQIEIFGWTYFGSFTFFQIFGYELKPHLSSTRISLNFDRLAEGCDKVRGPVEQNLGKDSSKYLWISRWEKNIWEIFALRRAGRRNFLYTSVFLSMTWLLNTPNFRLLRPALHVFCKYVYKYLTNSV